MPRTCCAPWCGAAHLPDDSLQLSDQDRAREHHLSELLLDEMRRASVVQLGVRLPQDKRLRLLCEDVLADPTRFETLEDWAQDTGASPRTVARLFRQELECSFTQWRQQVVLAHAVSLAARNWPIQRIAAELDYSPSAFSAMVRRTVGMPPAQFSACIRKTYSCKRITAKRFGRF